MELKNTTFECTIEGYPAPVIEWHKNGKKLMHSKYQMTTTTLVSTANRIVKKSVINFVKVVENDTAEYTCKGSNVVGMKMQRKKLNVLYPPELTYNFGHQQNLTESSTIVKFTCTVESHPISMIHWYKDGSRYTLNINDTVKVSTDIKSVIESSLVFPAGINRTDFGVYTCNASNELGIASFATDVTVWYGPEFRSNLTGQLDIMELKNTTFECTIEGYPAPVIEWHKNGKKLMHSKYQMTTTTLVSTANRIVKKSVINFVKVVENDTAEYTCKGSNVVGMKMQRKKLNVLYPPKLTYNFGHQQNLTESSTIVKFTCTVESHPISMIHWYKDGSRYTLNINDTVKVSTDIKSVIESSLVFPAGINRTDFGVYTCNASNELGFASYATDVTVWYGPEFRSHLTGQLDIMELKNTTFECTIEGYPAPVIEWHKNGKKLMHSKYQMTTTTLVSTANRIVKKSVINFVKVVEKDTAEYTCKGSNVVGMKMQRKKLNVLCKYT
eukprot:Seg1593.4 transcript_id=Seg1593.4/GoldUCD/mRNA.D3Y31 product=Hemicentin-1 protein_id=Seg1593.4/GoldUCD/D3Y31